MCSGPSWLVIVWLSALASRSESCERSTGMQSRSVSQLSHRSCVALSDQLSGTSANGSASGIAAELVPGKQRIRTTSIRHSARVP